MDVYKLRPEETSYKKINKDSFEADTYKRPPYYKIGEDGKMRYFAVCPACNNPIQIIGLYEPTKVSPNPFGKHFPNSILNLASYNQDEYDGCPYISPAALTPESRRKGVSTVSNAILDTLRKQFDRVLYIVQKDIEIHITENLASAMLRNYIASSGHMYTGATLMNIPWIFAYMAGSQNLVGRLINNSALKEHILTHVPEAIFNGNKLSAKNGKFLTIDFCFVHHVRKMEHLNLIESIQFVVSYKDKGKAKNIYQKSIQFNHEYFQNLINLAPEKAKRNMALLEVAQKLLTEQ